MKSADEMTQSVLERKVKYEKRRKTIISGVAGVTAVLVCVAVAGTMGKTGAPVESVPKKAESGIVNTSEPTSEQTGTTEAPTEQSETTSEQTGTTEAPTEQSETTTEQAETTASATDDVNWVFQPQDGTAGQVSYTGYKKVISGGDSRDAYSYHSPENGEYFTSVPLSRALDEYGNSVRYRIQIEIFKNGMPLDNSSAEAKKEIERISTVFMKKCGIGLSVLTFTDKDGKKTVTVTHDGAEKELIESFPASNEYGYFLCLYTPGEVDDTGAIGNVNGGVVYVRADMVAVVKHNGKLYVHSGRRIFKENPVEGSEEKEYNLSEFEAFKTEKLGKFIGAAKNDVKDIVAPGYKNTFDGELSSNCDGEVYASKDTSEDMLYLVSEIDDGILVTTLKPEK